MKTRIHAVRSTKLLAAILALGMVHGFLQAQPIPINNRLDGNTIIGTAEVLDGLTNGYFVVATSQGIYVAQYAFFQYYEKTYTVPAGRSIETIAPKGKSPFLIIALLDDGTVLEIDFTDFSHQAPTVTTLGQLGSAALGTSREKIIGDALYALGPSLYVSRDTGKTWQIDSAGLGSGVYFRDIALDTSQNVYAATTVGLFKQNPDSSFWHKNTTLTNPPSLSTVFIDRLNRIFVVGNSGNIVFSTDNGVSWNFDTAGIGALSLSRFSDDKFGNIYATAAFGSIYKSVGGTGPWTRIDAGILAITVNPPIINAITGDSIVVAATSFGVFATPDQGNTWYESNGGIQAESFYGFAKNNPNRILVSTDLGIYYNDAGDTAWHKSFPQSGYLGSLPINKDTSGRLYTVLRNPIPGSSALGPIYKSTDNGLTWIADTMGLSATTGNVFFVDERGGEHIGSSYNGTNYYGWVYAQDSSGNWIFDTTGIPLGSFSYASSFGTDRAGLIYLSGTYPGNPRVLHRSISGGTWTVDTVGLPSSVHFFYTMKEGKVGEVLGTNDHVMYRRSAGVWNQVPLPSSNIFKFTVDKSGTIFIVNTALVGIFLTDVGISMSTDNGASWTILTHDTVQVDALHSRGDTSYALLQNGGLYVLTKNGVVAGVLNRQTSLLPSMYELRQSYPNPFNPTATIHYNLSTQSHVSLKVYNLLGQAVATLTNGIEMAGYKEVQWNAANFASGVYFYRLEATSLSNPSRTFTQVKKMMLLK